MRIEDIRPNPSNPRYIKDDKFKKLVDSIKSFPQMLELRPLVIDENNIVLGGNMRLRACIEAGLTDVPVKQVMNFTQAQKDEFIIKDNSNYGAWDWDMIANEWTDYPLEEWIDVPSKDEEQEPKEQKSNVKAGKECPNCGFSL